MPLTDDMQLISVDDHLIEQPRVWQDRLPRKFLEVGPRIIEADGTETDQHGFGQSIPKGSQAWLLEGVVHPQLGLNAVAGKRPEELGTDPLRFSDMIPGCYDPEARIADMDVDGVQAAMLFPSFPKFAGTLFATVRDKELALQCTKAWNDYVFEEWFALYPGRFIPMSILPFWDVEESIAEVKRLAPLGLRAVSFPENPVPLGYPSFHSSEWDPLFDVLESEEIVMCLHFGTSGKPPVPSPEAPMAVMITLMGCNSMMTTVDLLFSPVFQKHPTLKVTVAEGGIGWIPYILERADCTWERHRFYQNVNQEKPPSDIFNEHLFGCFITDYHGIRNRHEIGIDRLTWEADYPHSDSNWPKSRQYAEEMFAEVPNEEVQRIVEWNSRELFRFPRS